MKAKIFRDAADNAFFEAHIWSAFVRESKPAVDVLVATFNRKKAGWQARTKRGYDTGDLDISVLHQYKFNENLFANEMRQRKGKNHGVAIAIDWSCSMSDVILNTVIQALITVRFCKTVNIPFRVYAMGSPYRVKAQDIDDLENLTNARVAEGTQDLLLVLSSEMSVNDQEDVMRTLLFFGMLKDGKASYWGDATSNYGIYELVRKYQNILSSTEFRKRTVADGMALEFAYVFKLRAYTPLNSCLVQLHEELAHFKARYRLDHTILFVLSDGGDNEGVSYVPTRDDKAQNLAAKAAAREWYTKNNMSYTEDKKFDERAANLKTITNKWSRAIIDQDEQDKLGNATNTSMLLRSLRSMGVKTLGCFISNQPLEKALREMIGASGNISFTYENQYLPNQFSQVALSRIGQAMVKCADESTFTASDLFGYNRFMCVNNTDIAGSYSFFKTTRQVRYSRRRGGSRTETVDGRREEADARAAIEKAMSKKSGARKSAALAELLSAKQLGNRRAKLIAEFIANGIAEAYEV